MHPLWAAVLLALLLSACAVPRASVAPEAEERRLIEYLARDPFVTITHLERTEQGFLLVWTMQGGVVQRYVLAPDDPASPRLALRRLQDACLLETAPDSGPPLRGLR